MSPLRVLLLLVLGCEYRAQTTDDSAVEGDVDTDTDADTDTTAEPHTAIGTITITGPSSTQPFDECGEVCFGASVTNEDGSPAVNASVDFEVAGMGYLAAGLVADAAGSVSFCAAAPETGNWDYTVSAQIGPYADQRTRTTGSFQVVPFGFDLGYDRTEEILTEPPWIPEFTRSASNPVLSPAESEADFDFKGPFVPTVVKSGSTYSMWYAGQQVENGDYVIGYADSADGLIWTKRGLNPDVSVPTGDVDVGWKATATNSPMLLLHDGNWLLFYTGKREATSDLNIGLATSDQYLANTGTAGSAFNLADVPTVEEGGSNPVMVHITEEEQWGGDAVAHPSVIWNEDQGFYEMWFSTGRHRVGYAISRDALTWTHYCRNPVLNGEGSLDPDGHMNWEMGRVKSTEVAYYDGYYMMTYTGGNTGDFQLGWAMSTDAIHWAKADEPVLGPDPDSTFENQALQGGFLVVDGSRLRMWYGASFAGGGVSGTTVNYAETPLPTNLP